MISGIVNGIHTVAPVPQICVVTGTSIKAVVACTAQNTVIASVGIDSIVSSVANQNVISIRTI